MKKFLLLLLLLIIGTMLFAQQRYALVIGNNSYTSVRRLDNPVNDATDIATKLRSLSYQVDLQTNVSNVEMARSITNFVQRLAQNRDNEGFFWFAGHAVQINGENYLLPIDVNSTNEIEAVHSSYNVKRLVDSLDQIARNKVNVVVLDACRDNPFINMPGSFRNVSRGLSVIQNLPSDLLIIYSTAAGAVAADGTGQRNSPFTQAFLQNMDSNEDIQIVFRAIARETMRLTNNNQRPFHDGSFLNLDFYSLNPQRNQPQPRPIEQLIPEGIEFEIIDGKSVTITKYTGNATILNIPENIQSLPVTVIGRSAFSRCTNLATINLTPLITSIEAWAFNDCSNLTSILIPSSVTSIGDYVFWGCTSLGNITIPSSVTSIGQQTFQNCLSLTNVNIPLSVTYINVSAFSGCSNLTNIIVDNRNSVYTSIDGVLLDENMSTILIYPQGKRGVTYIIHSSVTTIGNGAFNNNNNLTTIIIPLSVTTIGNGAFSNCKNLANITIPYSVTNIDGNPFNGCSNLTAIIIDNNNTVYTSIDGVLFDKLIRTIIAYPDGKISRTYSIPSSVTAIGGWAFYGSKLTNVIIPSSVTTIGIAAFNRSSLTSIDIPSSVTTIERGAFGNCSDLSNVNIPSSVIIIGEQAFVHCFNLKNVTISRRTQIGHLAFPDTTRISYRD
ncbi:MAG: leucine-rich repeat protein [Treponema sp.]|nr:leucine-rich repeat protein [Treponema sp.]